MHMPGRTPDKRMDDPEVQQRARELDGEREQAEEAAHEGGNAPLYGIATFVLLACGAWMALGTFFLGYPTTETGYDNVLRSLGAAVVVLLAGLWLVNVAATRWVAGLCVVVGAAEVYAAFGVSHDEQVTAYQFGIIGGLLMIAGTVAALAPRHRGRGAARMR